MPIYWAMWYCIFYGILYSCVFFKLGESIYVAKDLIPILLGSLPLAHNAQHSLVINPRRACAARVTVVVLCVCLSVCLFVSDYSRTTGYEVAYERYQQIQCYKSRINNVAILLKWLRSRDMAWKQAKKPICIMSTGLPRPRLARSAHSGRMKLLWGYVSKSSAVLNRLTITQLASLWEVATSLGRGPDHVAWPIPSISGAHAHYAYNRTDPACV